MLFNYFPLGFSPFVAHELRVFSERDSLWEPSNGDPTPGWFETSRSLPSRRHKGTCRISHPVLKNDLRRACFFFWHGSLHGARTIKLHWSRLVKKKLALLLLSSVADTCDRRPKPPPSAATRKSTEINPSVLRYGVSPKRVQWQRPVGGQPFSGFRASQLPVCGRSGGYIEAGVKVGSGCQCV